MPPKKSPSLRLRMCSMNMRSPPRKLALSMFGRKKNTAPPPAKTLPLSRMTTANVSVNRFYVPRTRDFSKEEDKPWNNPDMSEEDREWWSRQ